MTRNFSKYITLTTLLLLSISDVKAQDEFTPIVLWHGMGDSCCSSTSLGHFAQELNESLPGVHILSLQIGDNIIEETENGYLLHPDRQIEIACKAVTQDPLLSGGFNAIGFSQGGQFLRALQQRCSEAKIKNLISLGGQHQGVYGLPNCPTLTDELCDGIRQLLNLAAYEDWVQEALVQATYWHDPLNEEEYRNYSTFLSDINNELTINETYVQRLQALENLVLVKFEDDTVVVPVETEWFGFYTPGQSEDVQALNESTLYLEDRLGLRKLDEDDKLKLLSTPGNHLRFEWSWFEEQVIDVYLRN